MISESLIVDDILSSDFCNDRTMVLILGRNLEILSRGYWFDDGIGAFCNERVSSFSWGNNSIVIKVDFSI